MKKNKISNDEIENFFKILKSLKVKKKLPLHEPLFDNKDYKSVNNSLLSTEVSTYGKYTKIFENKLKKFCNSKSIISKSINYLITQSNWSKVTKKILFISAE